MSRIVPIFFCLLFLNSFSLEGQIRSFGSPSITNFSRSTYNAGTQNWAIEQDDSTGIVYIANNKGLLEFDGTYWQTYPLPNGTILRSVAIHNNGRIYIGGQDEFGYMKPDDNGELIYTSLVQLTPESERSFEDVWKIFIKENDIYFCSEKAIFKYSGEQIQVIKPRSQLFENFFQYDQKIIVQEIEGSVYELKDQQLNLLIEASVFPNERIIALLPTPDDQMLVFTFSQGIFLADDSGIRPWNSGANSFLKQYQAYCVTQLKNGHFAVGTPQNGVLIIDNAGKPKIHLNAKLGLQNNTVLAITQDVQGNIWLGLDNGIDYAEINSPFTKIQSEEGVIGTGYASIIKDDILYLGTNQGIYYTNWKAEKSSLNIERFKLVNNGFGQVWSLSNIENEVIVGQHKGVSYLEDFKVNTFSNVQGAWKFLPLEAHPGYALEGTYSGFYLFRKGGPGNKWQQIGRVEGFDESARIFEEDDAGNIWVSHAYKGLYKLSLSENLQLVEDTKLFDAENGLPNDPFVNVVKIRNELIFSTPKGVFRYDRSNETFVPHPDFIEIFGAGRNFHRLIEDELGNIWFSVDREFGVIEVEEQGVFNNYKVKYFNQIQDELVDGFEHVFAHDENNFIIGTKNGFLHYGPLEEKNTNFPFDISIRKVVSITQKDSTLYWGNSSAVQLSEQKFNYKMNDFRFIFSAPYYEKIGYLTYRFRLKGFIDEWTAWSPKTEKEYTNLDSGAYTFEVQAKNAYGQTSEVAAFPFKIKAPWYWSWYSKTGYLLLFLLGLFAAYKLVKKREQYKTATFKAEQVEKLEQKEAEFKKEVEKSESEIVKLRNEKLRSDVQHKTGQLAAATMHLVQKTEILQKIKNDLKQLESEATNDIKKKLYRITRTIEADIQLDENWEQFETYFDQVHQDFFKRLRLKYPELTPKDQKLCAYLRMNLTTKEIAPLMNISVRGVEISRYRLRKKLDLNSDVNLVTFMMQV